MERPVTVLTDINDLAELLNGSTVEQAELVSANGRMQLNIDMIRAMTERKVVVQKGPIRRVKSPWTKCRLALEAVQATTIKRVDQLPGEHPLLECAPVSGGYELTVRSDDGLHVRAVFEQLRGHFEDLGSPIEAP